MSNQSNKIILASDLARIESEHRSLKVKKLHHNAQLPKRQLSEDAGYDIYSPESITIPARRKCIVSTGIAIQLPECQIPDHIYCFKIISRSGLSVRNNIEIGAGLIDKSYIGEIKVILYNHSDKDHKINIGDRIAQGIIITAAIPKVIEVQELLNTDRGTNGFGSTGY